MTIQQRAFETAQPVFPGAATRGTDHFQGGIELAFAHQHACAQRLAAGQQAGLTQALGRGKKRQRFVAPVGAFQQLTLRQRQFGLVGMPAAQRLVVGPRSLELRYASQRLGPAAQRLVVVR